MTKKTNKGIKKMLSIFVYFSLISLATEVQAQAAYSCQANGSLSIYDWKMVQSGGVFFDGQVIGTASANIVFYYSGAEVKAFVEGGGGASSNNFNAIPMPQTPGVGVRISWQGYWAHGSYSFKADQQRPAGTYLSSPYWYSLLSGSAPRTFTITYSFSYEIVVIDADKYKGGKPVFTREDNVRAEVYSNNGSGGRYQCTGGSVNLLDALVNDATVPELPRPPVPTCSSTDINRAISLPPITVSQLAEYHSTRSDGMAAERRFELVGRRCPQGTKIMAFFTDARSSAEEKDYLKSSHPTVGVRLYHRENQNPIGFGAAPIGSTMPNRPAIVENQLGAATSDIYLPLTAQYVIAPNVDRGSVVPGRLNAEAVVTFIYD